VEGSCLFSGTNLFLAGQGVRETVTKRTQAKAVAEYNRPMRFAGDCIIEIVWTCFVITS